METKLPVEEKSISYTRYALLFFAVSLIACVVSFLVIGPFNMKVDGPIYVQQVEDFDQGKISIDHPELAFRAFKPLPGLFGALLTPVLSSVEAIQFMNILLVFLIPFAVFLFLFELGFKKKEAVWGAVWLTLSYPLLKYGLAISTDLGGWFFAFLTAGFALRGVRLDSLKTLTLASLIGFLGGAFKESGVFGLLFGGVYVLFTYKERPIKRTILMLVCLAAPALLLEGALLSILLSLGLPTFVEWFGTNVENNQYSFTSKITQLIGVWGSSFHILFIYCAAAFVLLFSKKNDIQKPSIIAFFALGISVLPILLWPLYVSRIIFIQALFILPFALSGLLYIKSHMRTGNPMILVLYILPPVLSVSLFILAGSGSLYDLL